MLNGLDSFTNLFTILYGDLCVGDSHMRDSSGVNLICSLRAHTHFMLNSSAISWSVLGWKVFAHHFKLVLSLGFCACIELHYEEWAWTLK